MRILRVTAFTLVAAGLIGCAHVQKPPIKEPTAPTSAQTPPSAAPTPSVDEPASDPSVALAVAKGPVGSLFEEYFAALNRGDYAAAAGYWLPSAGVTPEQLMVPGVSEWTYVTAAILQTGPPNIGIGATITFTVKVEPGTTTAYRNGINKRYVVIVQNHGWKIKSMP